MSNRLLNPCTTPGCHGRAETGRCEQCRRRQARTGRTKGEPYDRAWRNRRIDYLREHPFCCICARSGIRRLANVPDHHPRSRRELIALGVPDPDADEYMRPLCKRCHDRATAYHQPGGWHRDRTRWQA